MFHKPSTVQQNGKLPDQSYSITFFLYFYHRTKLLIFNITQIHIQVEKSRWYNTHSSLPWDYILWVPAPYHLYL